MAFPNKFPGSCSRCAIPVPAYAGVCEKLEGRWQVRCTVPCEARAQAPALPQSSVGELSGIMALFDKAAKHLKRPAIELGVPDFFNRSIRVHVATDRAKFPGSLTLLTAATFDNGGLYPERKWLGRLHVDGTLEMSRSLTADPRYCEAVESRLKAFAADPSKVGAEDGLLTGRCCFCRKSLTAEKSTAMGYGKKCASNFGLVWGAKPSEFAAAA